jgi:hypothetical protein
MARRKAPENETAEQQHDRRIKEFVSNAANRSEKTSWNRKMDNMVKLMSNLRPIEEKIVELQAQKIPIFDEIQQLRQTMVQECVHPYEYLVVHDDYIVCKFCDKKIRIPDAQDQATKKEDL